MFFGWRKSLPERSHRESKWGNRESDREDKKKRRAACGVRGLVRIPVKSERGR